MATTTSEKLIRCVIVTPEQTVLDTKAEGASLPLDDGSRGIAAGHAPFIGRLGAGEVHLRGVAGGRVLKQASAHLLKVDLLR